MTPVKTSTTQNTKTKANKKTVPDEKGTARRRYNSPLRKQQSAETRQRIIDAGAELVHEIPDWDWNNLTFKAISERAGISERTVYRHFSTERKLKDAVMQHLVDDSGVELEKLQLKDFSGATAYVFRFFDSIVSEPEPAQDPTFLSIDTHRRDILLQAVKQAAPKWNLHAQENAAAVLDILWNPPPYERLTKVWRFDTDRAIDAVSWLIQLIEEAVRKDQPPK